MLNSYAYASQMLIIIFKASADGANNTISSAEPNAPANMLSIRQPTPDCYKLSNKPSKTTVKSFGDNTAPCFTPFFIWNISDKTLFHLTWTR